MSKFSDRLGKILRTQIRSSTEVCQEINKNKRQLSYLQSKSGLTPIIRTSQGDLYSEDDVARYRYKKGIYKTILKEIYGGTIEECKLAIETNDKITHQSISSITLYFDPFLAIQDGYFVIESFPQINALTKIEAPSMVVTLKDSTTLYFKGFHSGYYGKATQETYGFLRSFNVKSEIAELVYNASIFKVSFEDDDVKCTYKTTSDIAAYKFNDKNFYYYNSKIVKLFSFYNDSYLRNHEMVNLYNTINGFLGDCFKISIFNNVHMYEEGRVKLDLYNEELYPIILHFGDRELWISAKEGINRNWYNPPQTLAETLKLFFDFEDLEEKEYEIFNVKREISIF